MSLIIQKCYLVQKNNINVILYNLEVLSVFKIISGMYFF